MAPAWVYIAVWSVITIINIYGRGAVAGPLAELKFVREPQDVVVLKGNSVTLECSALSGTELVNITWLKDGQVVTNSKRVQINLSGDLRLRKFARRHVGEYQCIAANDVGKIISKPASVVAAYKGKIKNGPKPTNSISGDDVRFECIIEGKPAPNIQWQKDKQPLPQNSRHIVLESGALHLSNVNPSDEGLYRCVSTNIAGIVNSSEAALTVNTTSQDVKYQPIVIQSQFSNVTKAQGSSAVFECFASGRPKPTISWFKDGKTLVTSEKCIITEENNLEINGIRYKDTGNYTCKASTNSPQHSVTKHSYLRVLVPPLLDTEPENIFGRPKSSTVRFTCIFQGYPEPKVRWFQNGKEMQESGRVKFQQQATTVVISQTEPSDSGYIQCWGTNDAGTSSAIMSLSIVPPKDTAPDPPTSLFARSLSSTVIEVAWIPAPPKKGIGAMGFSVHYAPTEGGAELQKVIQATSVRVDYLKPATNYSFYIIAYNEHGASDHSTIVTQVTASKIPPDPTESDKTPLPSVTNVQVTVLNSTAVRVGWDSVPADVVGEVRFSVKYKEHTSSNSVESALQIPKVLHEGTVTVKSAPALVVGLKPYTNYMIQVRSEGGDATGPYTDSVVCTLFEGVPSAPIKLNVEWIEPESMALSWQSPEHHNGNVRYYVIYYTTDQSLPLVQWNTITKNGSVREAVVSGLQRHKTYFVKLAAATRIGQGETTSIYPIQTTTSSPVTGWFSDKDKGILVGVAIGGTCIIICVIIIVLRNRCSQSSVPSNVHSNGHVPNLNGGPPNGLVHHVDSSLHEMDSFTPMLSPHVPFNKECDTKGGYNSYPRVERARILKDLNSYNGGRTRTVSSGYTSDRDLDHIDEGIHVQPHLSMVANHSTDLEENHNSHGIDSFGSNSNMQRGSWPSHCGSASGSQDSNKDSGTGTECLGGGPSSSSTNGDHMGSCHTLTGCNITRSSSSPGGHSGSHGGHYDGEHISTDQSSNLLPNSTSVATNKSMSLSHHNHLQGGHSSSGINRVKQQQPDCSNKMYGSSPGEQQLVSQNSNCVKTTALPSAVATSNAHPRSKSNCTQQQPLSYPVVGFCGSQVENAAVAMNNKGVHSQGILLPQDGVAVQEHNSTSLPLLGTHKDFSRTGVS